MAAHPAQLKDILLKLCRREDLTRGEARDAFMHIMSGQATDAQIGGLLVGLAAKGTTVEELVGAATVMREKAVGIGCEVDGVVLDTCGTGGDVRGTFNISTAAAIVVAAAGVPGIISGDMVKPGAAVLDVGVSRVDGKIAGDVAGDVWDTAGWVSPNPGGVGPMTRAMLLSNVVSIAEQALVRA